MPHADVPCETRIIRPDPATKKGCVLCKQVRKITIEMIMIYTMIHGNLYMPPLESSTRFLVVQNVLWVDLCSVVNKEFPKVRLANYGIKVRISNQSFGLAISPLHMVHVSKNHAAKHHHLATRELTCFNC